MSKSSSVPPLRYTRTAVVLHWLIAALMVVNVSLGLLAQCLPDKWVRLTIDTHKSVGITVLGLGMLRLLWRFAHTPPQYPARYRTWERRLSMFVHGLLYTLIFVLPLSGWAHDSAWNAAATHPMRLFGIVPWPRIGIITALEPTLKDSLHTLFGQWHTVFGYLLYAAVGLHVAGALKHQFVDREPLLRRMGW
ncbi:cytochrome b [Solimonas terrae]|uniref:Cytochrome b n=1 Tax=Solimonas terrae TaxID=1396819 RepID=A0A6M2BPA7_9GAMM|nr:cytochrome b [Solimonas terrae]NGY03863.1 cytochrome b [Solimonas terrae]